jgi:S-disulfanyl-L-cysteine oxidoreductase SoxD
MSVKPIRLITITRLKAGEWNAMDRYETYTHKRVMVSMFAILLTLGSGWEAFAAEERGGYGLGRPASDEEIRAWNMDVSPTGEGLPPGRGTVEQGAQVYAEKCAACHGPTGVEGPKDKLVGGRNTLTTPKPIRTIGSYWPYATTVYDYIHRAMPFNAPQSLTPDETYAVIAWLLFQNQVIGEDAVIDSQTLTNIQMPNRNGFIPDPRPDVR